MNTNRVERMDRARAWECEAMYFDMDAGLGEVDPSTALVTPSGQPTKQAGSMDWFSDAVKSILPVAANVYQQRELTKLNVARINAGQTPITADQFARTYQPPSARVSIGPDNTAKKFMMIGGALVVGFIGLKALGVIK